MSDLVGNPKDRFSHEATHMSVACSHDMSTEQILVPCKLSTACSHNQSYEPPHKKTSGLPTRPDTNWEKMARGLKTDLGSRWIHYLCSENKGGDQLPGYSLADLRLCFTHMHKAGF